MSLERDRLPDRIDHKKLLSFNRSSVVSGILSVCVLLAKPVKIERLSISKEIKRRIVGVIREGIFAG